ncbi:D-alanyl-D-alanine carboxypeptidase [candidate division WWE3 bacterium]|jgi:D-alanyl-D-alanine carboxypeptidase|uniref:D-alanyl-D-alanine carboxypeptidase n=1 Tax=candidate division WWE3 bacterium TaxID=2053526 RepID=A0A3A4ZCC4_UNCKA|nr:MAG: D-alanyl-D-alanine carboxypeptidase [candidate division WWE3 bacterium]
MLSHRFLSKILFFVFFGLILFFAGSFLKKHSRTISSLPQLSGKVSLINTETAAYYNSLNNKYDPELGWVLAKKDIQYGDDMVVAEAALLFNADTGEILYQKNSSAKLRIASLVKIMTAVVALEHGNLNKEITVSDKAASIGENSMGISSGEIYSLEELLYGLLLNSGNDAAYAIAEGIAGDSQEFVKWMNIKAKELGLSNTFFADPSGLDDTTLSTTDDLGRLSRYAMKNPDFRRIVKTTDIILTSDSHKYLYLENQTNLLTTYPGVQGIKTGFTEEAGLCLVTYAVNEGKELIGVVLNSIDRKGDMILMLDHGFSQYGIHVEHNLLDY